MIKIQTSIDLMHALAAALDTKDLDAVDQIERQVADWMQTQGARAAQANLIEAVRNAINEMIG
jgi:hypothetical protein